jgi:hypothetical protein
MSYRDFTFPDVCDRLQLGFQRGPLFTDITPAALPDELIHRIHLGVELAQGLNTEKGRSEFVIAPFLLHLSTMTPGGFGLFSGNEFNVDPQQGLNGVCDFLIARDPMVYILRAPVLAVAEAKNDNVNNGFGQCIATMKAAEVFNARSGQTGPVYGLSTTGVQWKFFRLHNDVVTLDNNDYVFMADIGMVAATLLRIVNS